MEASNTSKLKSLFFKYSGLLFCAFIIMLYLFTHYYAVESVTLKVILICIYFIVTITLLYGMYKSNSAKLNLIAALLLPLLMVPMIANPILLIPLIGILFLYYKFNKWRTTFIIALVIFAIMFCIAGFLNYLASIFSGFGIITDLQDIPSPNGQYSLILRESDEGALGGSVEVLVEENISSKQILGIVKRVNSSDRKILYYGHWGERPEISWVDDENVRVNGREFNVFDYDKWNNKK